MGCIGNLTRRFPKNATTPKLTAVPARIANNPDDLAAHQLGKQSFAASLAGTALAADVVDMSFATGVSERFENAPKKLELAVYRINNKITSRASEVSVAPQYSTVVSELRQVITEQESERQQAELVSNKYADVDLLSSNSFVDALELDTEITTCITIAGGS